MKTMKMAIYIMLALFLSGMASCGSEDSINPIPELGNPPFDSCGSNGDVYVGESVCRLSGGIYC